MSRNTKKIKQIMALYDQLNDKEQKKALAAVSAAGYERSAKRSVASSCSKT